MHRLCPEEAGARGGALQGGAHIAAHAQGPLLSAAHNWSRDTPATVQVAQPDWLTPTATLSSPFLWAISPALDSGHCSVPVLFLPLRGCFFVFFSWLLSPPLKQDALGQW